MKQVIRWILLCVLGWLGVVKSIQHHTACLTLHTIATSHLDIKCNPDKIVYVINQLSINSLGKSYTDYIAKNDTECQNTTSSSCFRSITTDLSLDYTSKISHFCNGKHNCTIQYNDLKNPFVDMFTTSCECCIDHLFYIRIGSSYECLPSKSQVLVGKNISQTRNGFLYLRSNETGRCLIRGTIESARILEQVNMRFTVSGRKSRLCTEWLIGVKTIRTTCKSMEDLIAKTRINCKTGEIIFVNEQSINFLVSDYPKRVINNNECKNSTSSKCFLYLAKDYSSYFNISKSCNGKEKCTLGYSDMYNSAIQFARSCEYSKGSDFDLLRIGVSNECFNYKNQIIARKNISEIRDGSLYLRSNETGRCLITGSIESARILEHVNMRFNVSGRKSRLCTKMLPNGSFEYNEDLSCLVGVNGFYLDIQATKTKPRKLWMEFKGTLLQLACGDNIQLPSESEQNVRSTLFPMIMGLVAGLLLLLALILVVLKRRHALTIRAETKRCTINLTTTLEGDQDRTYYNNDVDKPRNNANDVQGTSSSLMNPSIACKHGCQLRANKYKKEHFRI